MKKALALAGPAAALIAFKCPFCILALAGISAGVASFAPVIQGTYWVALIALGGIFLWFLYRSWNLRTLSGWVLGLGGLGFAGLIFQVATEAEGIMSYAPGAALLLASIVSFAGTKQTQAACCAAREATMNMSASNEQQGGSVMANKRKVEVFTSGCPLCEPVVELVKKTACSSCEVVIYDLNAGCDTNDCRDKAKQYGVTRVPAVVVNGKLLDCCETGTVSETELRAAGIGAP